MQKKDDKKIGKYLQDVRSSDGKFGIIYKCKCGCAGLEIVQDEIDDDILDICIWRYCSINSHPRSLKDRLKLIWSLLKNEKLYSDDICLDLPTVDDLIRDLYIWSKNKHNELDIKKKRKDKKKNGKI